MSVNLFGQKCVLMVAFGLVVCTFYIFQNQLYFISRHLQGKNNSMADNTSIKRVGLENLRFLTRENLQHIIIDNEKDCVNRKFLVYRCDASTGCGGWGDRQKGIITTFLMALLTNRTFTIDISKPCAIQKILEPHIYNWTSCKPYLSKLDKKDISDFHYIDAARKRLGQIETYDFESKWSKKVVVLRINELLIDGLRLHKHVHITMKWLINTTNDKAISKILHTLFKPTKQILEDFTKFSITHKRGKYLVCCHIRIGNNPSIPTDSVRKLNTNKSVIFNFLRGFDDSKKNVIYVATDADYLRKEAAAELKTYININRTIVHVDRFGKLKASSLEACEGFYTAIFEQYILSSCNTLVITRSGFGIFAAYLRGVSENLFMYNHETHQVLKADLKDILHDYHVH